MKKMPTPEQRPDLYDDFDGIERPAGQGTGVTMPDYIQKLIQQRSAKPATKDSTSKT